MNTRKYWTSILGIYWVILLISCNPGTNAHLTPGISLQPAPNTDLSQGDDQAIDIVAGNAHMCALLANGTIHCWGHNQDNQLNLTRARNAQNVIYDITNSQFSKISAGDNHTCGIVKGGTFDGIPLCFGKEGEWLNVAHEKVLDVSTGSHSTCVIKMNGTLTCVGLQFMIMSKANLPQRIRAEDIVLYGIDPVTKQENQNFSQKTFKNIKVARKAGLVCGQSDDDKVYCMGDNQGGMGESIAQKALDYVPEEVHTILILDDYSLRWIGRQGTFGALPKLAKPAELKFKKMFSGAQIGLLTAVGNFYDDGTSMPENTFIVPKYLVKADVLGFASGRGEPPGVPGLIAYCLINKNHKVSCKAYLQGEIDNRNSLIVKNIPAKIAE
jgi:hypothetical protein